MTHTITIYQTAFLLPRFVQRNWTNVVVQRCSIKKVFLKVSQNAQENTYAKVSFLIKLQACNFIKKETLLQVFSCESCEIFKNTYFYRTPLMTAPDWNCTWSLTPYLKNLCHLQEDLERGHYLVTNFWSLAMHKNNSNMDKVYLHLKCREEVNKLFYLI